MSIVAICPVISPAGRDRAGARICVTKRTALSYSSLLVLEAPSEGLDVMERSPDLPLHFADEYLEPSASCGANAVADQVAAAIKRSSPGERVAPPQPVVREIRTPSLSDAAPPETFAKIKTETAAVEKRRGSARNRFAAFSIAAGLVVAACVGMYFRAEQDFQQSLLQERDRVAALARELAMARRDLATEVVRSSKATEEADRLRKAANALTEQLEQERSRSAALARDLESAQRMISAYSTRRPVTRPAR
jgi:hypothetical protein